MQFAYTPFYFVTHVKVNRSKLVTMFLRVGVLAVGTSQHVSEMGKIQNNLWSISLFFRGFRRHCSKLGKCAIVEYRLCTILTSPRFSPRIFKELAILPCRIMKAKQHPLRKTHFLKCTIGTKRERRNAWLLMQAAARQPMGTTENTPECKGPTKMVLDLRSVHLKLLCLATD